MIINDFSDIGQITNTSVNGGRLQDKNTNMSYRTPYQFKFEGILVNLAISSTYDAAAVPTKRVAIPATSGSQAKGYAFVNTYKQHPLPGATDELFPLTANCGETDGQGIAYAGSIANWTSLSFAPLNASELIGVPVKAGVVFNAGDEIAAFDGGFATKAISGYYIIGYAEYPVDNSAGANGAKFVAMKPEFVQVKKA